MSSLTAIAIIPARMGSSRFPGKPMAKIAGIPMIGHVWKRCQASRSLAGVYVATCDQVIFDYVTQIGGRAIMTGDRHERASDRCAEALITIEKELGKKVDVIVMVQGDEPLTNPEMIEQSLKPFQQDSSVNVVNLLGEITTQAEFEDPNCIKVVTDFNGNAVYFSRSPVPHTKKWTDASRAHKQVCIIPFRREYLLKFSALVPVASEIQESIDMLRFLENGVKVKMVPTPFRIAAVDTPDDLRRVDVLMEKDPYFVEYRNDSKLK